MENPGKTKVEDFLNDLSNDQGLILVKIDLITGSASILFLNDIPTEAITVIGQTLINFAQKTEKDTQENKEIEPLMN